MPASKLYETMISHVINGDYYWGLYNEASRNNDYDICDSSSRSADGSLLLNVFLL